MAVTRDDIKAFSQFADEKLASDGAESLRDLVAEYEQRQEVNAAIREGIADIDAGRTRPAGQFMAEVREKLDSSS